MYTDGFRGEIARVYVGVCGPTMPFGTSKSDVAEVVKTTPPICTGRIEERSAAAAVGTSATVPCRRLSVPFTTWPRLCAGVFLLLRPLTPATLSVLATSYNAVLCLPLHYARPSTTTT
jgi:hypothetical protein